VLQVACGLLVIAATLVASRFSETVDLNRFPLAWAGVLIALDGAARLRQGASPLRRPSDWLACAAASVLFWDLFELLDLRLENWWYTGVSPSHLAGAAFGALSFATVLPAVRLGLSALSPRVEPPLRTAPGGRPGAMLALGLAMLGLAIAFPKVAFPLAWLFLWPLCEEALRYLPRAADGLPSPLEVRRAGDWRLIWRLLALALPLGLVWESLNWGCARGWVYTVPRFEAPKLFEMPLVGYLGYVPFLLEAGAMLALLDRLRPHLRGLRAAAALGALVALHLWADGLSRGRTIVSVAPELSQLSSPAPQQIQLLAAQGIRTPRDFLAKSPQGLREREAGLLRAVSELETKTHMGLPRAERWLLAGVDPLRDSWEDIATRTGDEPALVRLWIEAARRGVVR
jgi:hypothetical protein